MDAPIIEVNHLSKRYRLGSLGARSLRDEVESLWRRFSGKAQTQSNGASSAASDFWALQDVTFSVQPGEVLGVIGRNGAGKSTLLKILSRITEPTSGEAIIRGRVASLLEVGTGFHPELSGRDNIYLNGAILGMKRWEIQKKFDEIVTFAEIEKFIDTPVKRYSSGMYVRLAFAVAAHLEPEILIVDEVLAVGDAAFQKKCLGKMGEVARHGRTVLFVSHNMGAVDALTQKCLYLEKGGVAALGESHEIVELYLLKGIEASDQKARNLDFYRSEPNTERQVEIHRVIVNGSPSDSHSLPSFEVGTDLRLEIELKVTRPLHGANVTLIIKNARGEHVAVLVSWDSDFKLNLSPGVHKVEVLLNDLPLAPGKYLVNIGIDQNMESKALDGIADFPLCSITNTGRITHWLTRPWGLLHPQRTGWRVDSSVSSVQHSKP